MCVQIFQSYVIRLYLKNKPSSGKQGLTSEHKDMQ